MMKDRVRYYYNCCDCNCAETLLHSGNDEYHLNLGPEAYRAIAGFGGGIGCGNFCGAIAGAIAVLGERRISTSAHSTEGFGAECAAFLAMAEQKLGSLLCNDLKAKYRTDAERCLKTVELAAEALEEYEAGRNQ